MTAMAGNGGNSDEWWARLCRKPGGVVETFTERAERYPRECGWLPPEQGERHKLYLSFDNTTIPR